MRIAIAADHRGYTAKDRISMMLREQGHDVIDVGTNSTRSCDYTDMAFEAAKSVAQGQTERAILFCGSGIGMCITANKVAGIRAASCNDELTAQMARRHNNTNVLCVAADLVGEELIRRIVEVWLETEFEAGRHLRRIEKIAMIEQGKDPSTYVQPNG